MGNAREISDNILSAFHVMQAAYGDVAAVIGIVSEGLGSRGWVAPPVGKLIGDTANNWTQPGQWLPGRLYRLFVQVSEQARRVGQVLVVEVILQPPNVPVPVVASLSVRLKRPSTPKEFWSQWNWVAEPTHWHLRLADALESADAAGLGIDGPQLEGTMQLAESARLICTELCSLTRENARERLLDPIFALLETQ